MKRFALIAVLAAGCGTAAPIEVMRRGGADEVLGLAPVSTAFSIEEAGASIVLTDIDPARLESDEAVSGQVLHVGFLWNPLPGRTAIDPTSTNVSLRLLVLSAGEAGLYGGGGFASVSGSPESGSMSLEVEGSDLRLIARTKGFVDRLTPAELLGEFSVDRNEAQARRMRRAATQRVTNALGAIRWVDAGTGLPTGIDLAATDEHP
jgi:hypothetical protein